MAREHKLMQGCLEEMSDDEVRGYLYGLRGAHYIVAQADPRGTDTEVERALKMLHDRIEAVVAYMAKRPKRFERGYQS
jgi:hypothetical protein